MKKKNLLCALALGLALPSISMLTGCDHEHTFSTDWSNNDTHHWHTATCEHLEEKSGYAEHTYDDNADTTCNDCGKVREVILTHTHTYDSDTDNSCNGCGEIRSTVNYDLWDGSYSSVPAEQNGVIILTTAEQFAGFAKAVNEGEKYIGKTIKLAIDIDLQNRPWKSIGTGSDYYVDPTEKCFGGTFDGDGHTIYNLNVKGTPRNEETGKISSMGVGLFGQLYKDAKIQKLNIDTAKITGNRMIGALCGFAGDNVVIDDCHVTNATIVCNYYDEDDDGGKAGGLLGYLRNNTAVVKNSSVSNSNISACKDAGQLIGCMNTSYGATEINNTATKVTVTDINGVQNPDTQDRIKNQLVGREV